MRVSWVSVRKGLKASEGGLQSIVAVFAYTYWAYRIRSSFPAFWPSSQGSHETHRFTTLTQNWHDNIMSLHPGHPPHPPQGGNRVRFHAMPIDIVGSNNQVDYKQALIGKLVPSSGWIICLGSVATTNNTTESFLILPAIILNYSNTNEGYFAPASSVNLAM